MLLRFVLDTLLSRPRLLAGAALLLTLLALPFLSQLRVDNALEVWLDEESPAFLEYQDFLATFGSEEYILLIYDLPESVDLSLLEPLTDLRLDLEEIDGVREIYGLAGLYSRFFSMRGIDAFNADLRVSPFYRYFLISEDGEHAAQWIWLDIEAPSERARIVKAVEEVVARAGLPGSRLAGSPVLSVALDRASQRSAMRLFPAVFGLSALLLSLLFRRLYGVVIPFVAVGMGIIWTLALLAATGHTLNMVTVALPPLVWVLGLSTSIHLISRVEQLRRRGSDVDQARRQTLVELLRPCGLSALTTALGFASLLVSDMEPVREMGAFAALGVLSCLTANLLLFPTLSRWVVPASRATTRIEPFEALLDGLATWTQRYARLILVGFFVLVLGLGWGITRLRAEASVIEFFKADSDIAVTYKQILPSFTGAYSLEVVVEPPDQSLDTLTRLDAMVRGIEELDSAQRVLSSLDLLKKVHQMAEGLPPGTSTLPADGAALARAREELAARLTTELAAFEKNGELRFSVLTSAMASDDHRQLSDDLRAFLGTEVDPAWKPRLTGIVQLLVDLQRQLLDSQVRSFAFAFLIIGPVMALFLRSGRDALISLLPNLFPILSVLGLMGWLGIPLDPATVMIAGIALGIAVDDTIHFLVHYRAMGEDSVKAMRFTFQTAGRAMIRTTLIAAVGFLVLALAEFIPLIYFGLLTSWTMFAALLGDLLLLPAILHVFRPRQQ